MSGCNAVNLQEQDEAVMMGRSSSKLPPRRAATLEESPSTQDEPDDGGDERHERAHDAHPRRPNGRRHEAQHAHQ
jgi:hypothetical protein